MKQVFTLLVAVSLFSFFSTGIEPNKDIIIINNNQTQGHHSVWYENSLDFDQDFQFEASVELSSVYKSDGLTFAFTNGLDQIDTANGQGNLGYIGSLHIPNSLVFELDGYWNGASSDIFISDIDIPQDLSEIHFGHLAFIETNDLFTVKNDPSLCNNNINNQNLCRKHKVFKDLRPQSVGPNEPKLIGTATKPSKFDVQLSWDAKLQELTAEVLWHNRLTTNHESLFTLTHQFDPISVFGKSKDIHWGFTSAASSNGLKASVSMASSDFPHQVDIEMDEIEALEDSKKYNIKLKKSILHDLSSYKDLELISTDNIESISIDGVEIPIVNGLISLNDLDDNEINLEVNINKKDGNTEHVLNLMYQNFNISKESEWQTPNEVPSEPEIPVIPEKPTLPLIPLEPAKPTEPVKPTDPTEPDKPIHPVNPEIPNNYDDTNHQEIGRPQGNLDDDFFINPPRVDDDLEYQEIKDLPIGEPVVKESNKYQITSQLEGRNPNAVRANVIFGLSHNEDDLNWLKNNLIAKNHQSLILKSGANGNYGNGITMVTISNFEADYIPLLNVDQGYYFIGYFDKYGKSIESNESLENEFTAHYKIISQGKSDLSPKGLNPNFNWIILILLILLRFILKRDIKRRKDLIS